MTEKSGAEVLVKSLEAQGVKYIFGIPGAKVDKVFDALTDSSIELVVCRHEQNAVFIAGGWGRMTGEAGVCLVTSGPGCTNLATGLVTATYEGDPVVALGGLVPVSQRLKLTHQTLDTTAFFKPITKYSVEINSSEAIGESIANAFRAAESGRPGGVFVGLPQDVMVGPCSAEVLTPVPPQRLGAGDPEAIAEAARRINAAEGPVLFLGMLASQPGSAMAIRHLLDQTPIPVVSTFQGTGIVPKERLEWFAGRVGLFRNQPADELLGNSDCVIAIGYDQVEYDPALWNAGQKREIIHIDAVLADIDKDYRPTVEITGEIADAVAELGKHLKLSPSAAGQKLIRHARLKLEEIRAQWAGNSGMPVHPLRLIHDLQSVLTDDTTLLVDMGSVHLWHGHYLYSFQPRQMLITNGQQTLGVALPWAIAACLARPKHKVISVSGDGGFLFSAMELETAVRLKCNFVHLIWTDGTYNMIAEQELLKYGRVSGCTIGAIDVPGYAEAFGAKGFKIAHPDEFLPTLRKAMEISGPVLIEIPVDYSHNSELYKNVLIDILH